jgi:hypothetical protein
MPDMTLPFFVGPEEKMKTHGVETSALRKSKAGLKDDKGKDIPQKALIHMSVLSMEQFDEMRFDADILTLTHDEAAALNNDAEWSTPE